MNPHGNNVNPFLGSLLLRPRDGAPLWICHDYDQMFNLQVQVRLFPTICLVL